MTTSGTRKDRVFSAAVPKKEDGSLFMLENIKETIRPTLRVLLDTGAGSSFISSTLANHLDCLEGLQFDNEDDKPNHPIHIILGAGDIARIKSTGFMVHLDILLLKIL